MPTQTEIAKHLDLSVTAVSTFCKKHDLKYANMSMDKIRIFYIRQLREKAAGRSSEKHNLTDERAKLAHINARKAEIELAKQEGTLVLVEDVNTAWAKVLASVRAKLLSIPSKIAKTCYGLERVQIQEEAKLLIHEALEELVEDTAEIK